jgi:YgiT-type zinc finger domain-containing protein
MEEKTQENIIPCMECQAGRMHHKAVTYMTYIGDELIAVPNFPAWVCDVCGRREYDNQALNQLSLLLSPNAGRNPGRKTRITGHTGSKPKEPRTIKPS